jgi:hypothetical protein
VCVFGAERSTTTVGKPRAGWTRKTTAAKGKREGEGEGDENNIHSDSHHTYDVDDGQHTLTRDVSNKPHVQRFRRSCQRA